MRPRMTMERELELREIVAFKSHCSCHSAGCIHDGSDPLAEALDEIRALRADITKILVPEP